MKPLCYVCGHEIRNEPVYVGRSRDNERLYRHHRCEPGSKRWLASEVARKSEIGQFFNHPEGKEAE